MKEFHCLNLGCGSKYMDGYINVDKYGEPEVLFDLETFPWPWETNSVEEIVLHHVLEHLGQNTNIYLNIMKEMYRVCKHDAKIYITVPHPRHDDFMNDPTHVRPVTPGSLELFSKSKNKVWLEEGNANTSLGIYLDVNFEIINIEYNADPLWCKKVQDGEILNDEILLAEKKYNNVIKEIKMTLATIKN